MEMPLWDFIVDKNSRYGGGGSTDVGDVSWVVPTGQVYTNCYAAGTAMHSWQAVAQGKSAIAHKGMMAAAKVMAMTGAQLLLNPDLVEKGKGRLERGTGRRNVSESAAEGFQAGNLVIRNGKKENCCSKPEKKSSSPE